MRKTNSATRQRNFNRSGASRARRNLAIYAASAVGFSSAVFTQAATYTHTNAEGALNSATYWTVGGVAASNPPTSTDIGLFNSTMTAAGAAGQQSVGGAYPIGELQITNPGLAISIIDTTAANVLTIDGVSNIGIDMSSATQSLTIGAPLAVGASQTWNIASSKTLTLNGINGISLGSSVVSVYDGGTLSVGYSQGTGANVSTSSTGAGLAIYGSTLTTVIPVSNPTFTSYQNYLGASTALTMTGSTLIAGEASNSGSNYQIYTSLTLGAGANSFQQTTRGTSSGNSVGFGGLTRYDGAVADFAAFQGSSNFELATNAYGIAGSSVVGYATYAGNDWALEAGATAKLTTANYTNDIWGPGDNTNVTGNDSPSSGSTTGTLRFNTAAALTVTYAGTNTISTGGILVGSTTGANNSTITGGNLTSGNTNADGTHDLILINNNTAGGNLIVNSNIVNNGGNAVGITEAVSTNATGSGAVQLGGTNTFTGASFIDGGTLTLTNANAWNGSAGVYSTLNFAPHGTLAGAGTFLLNGNSISIGGLSTTLGNYTNAFVQNANATPATLTIAGSGGNSFSGALQDGTGGGPLSLAISISGTQILAGSDTYTGGTTISAGTLQLGSSTALPSTGTLTVNGTGNFDLNGNNATTTYLSDGGVATGAVTSSTGVPILTVNATTPDSFSGSITGSLSLTLGGSSVVTLSGANTYSGVTSINGGTLKFSSANNLGNASATNTISLNGGSLELASGNAVTFTNQAIALAGAGTFQTDTGATLTVNANISGAGGLNKAGPGALALGGTDSYGGATTLYGGTLSLNFAASGAPASGIISSGTSALALYGGSLLMTGAGSGTSAQTFGALTVNAGAGQIQVNSGASNTSNLTATTIARSTGAAVIFGLPSTGSILLSGGTASTLLTGAGSAPYAFVANSSGNIIDFAAKDSSNSFVVAGNTLGSTVYSSPTTAGNVTVSNTWATPVLDLVSNGTTTGIRIGSSFAVTDGIRFNSNRTGDWTIDTAATGRLLSTGGILVTSNVGNYNVNVNDVGAIRQPTAFDDLVIAQDNTGGWLNITTNITTGSSSSATQVVKLGKGTLVLNNSTGTSGAASPNGYSGQTFLDGGYTLIYNDGDLGSVSTAAELNLEGGALVGAANLSLDNGSGANTRGVYVSYAGGTLATASSTTLTVDGQVTGVSAGALTIGTSATTPIASTGGSTENAAIYGSGTVILSASNTYAGGTIVSAGSLYVNNTTGSGTGTGAVTVNAGKLGGTGIISGNVSLTTSSASIEPGSGAGTGALTVNGLMGVSGSTLIADLKVTSPGSGGDSAAQLIIPSTGGTLTLSNMVLDLNLLSTPAGALNAPGETFVIIDNKTTESAATEGTFASIIPPSGAGSPYFTYSVNYGVENSTDTAYNDVSVTVTAVPEPTSLGLLGLGGMGLMRRRRRHTTHAAAKRA